MCQLNVLHIASARNFVHRCSGSDVALSRPTLTAEAIVPSLLLIARPRAEHPDFSTASMHGSVSLYIVAQKSELASIGWRFDVCTAGNPDAKDSDWVFSRV